MRRYDNLQWTHVYMLHANIAPRRFSPKRLRAKPYRITSRRHYNTIMLGLEEVVKAKNMHENC